MTPAPNARTFDTRAAAAELSPQAQARAKSLLDSLHIELDRTTRRRVRSRRITAGASAAVLALLAWFGFEQLTPERQAQTPGAPAAVNNMPERIEQATPGQPRVVQPVRIADAPAPSAASRLAIREVTNRSTAVHDLTTDQLLAQLHADGSRMGLLIIDGKTQIVYNHPAGPTAEDHDHVEPGEQH